ncbi:dipeptidase [Novosphingobium sp. 1949]|uniref:Dipeptidase n=1 Tax=Novosphingobium organovorum TaxID=2930092 RepID=A0ABT0BCL0_9SPHN|nr:dipeptidase [Novosphingobium organovorum]MCJ2182794.1 dipeptidase [Novosphingobium organovorum]
MLLPLLAASTADPASAAEKATLAEATALQKSLVTLDTHLDTPASLDLPGWSIMDDHDVHADYTQVDVPRMVKGALDGGFWAIYTPQGPLDAEHFEEARDFAVKRGLAIRTMVAAHPETFGLALESGDAAKIKAAGKRIVFMSIENAYPLAQDPTLASLFYAMGVRLMGFAHFRNNQFADSSTDPAGPKWHGLSPLGKDLLAQANKLGMVVDASHSSDDVLNQLIDLSTTPVLLSHSGCKAVYDHPRNVSDDLLRKLAAHGGVIQINSFGSYLRAAKPNPERQKAMGALFASMHEGEEMTPEAYQALLAKRRAIDAQYPDTDRPTYADFEKHLLHALEVVGPDHVGIGMDWDGGGGVAGLEDASGLPRITQTLLDHGYSREDIAKIWGGNVLRLLAKAEAARQK